jgi:hypothetical protein
MTNKDISAIVTALHEPIKQALSKELIRDIDERMDAYRRAVYVRDEWCCNTMTQFAVKTWQAAKPRTGQTFGSVAFMLHGHVVNYCPFCGVSFLAPSAAHA